MTAVAAGRPPFDPDEAEENSAHKGDLIAEYLYRTGLSIGDVAWLPHTDRSGPSRGRLARAAYRAVHDPCPKRGDHSAPHSATSETWVRARAALAELETLARMGVAPYPRDLTGQAAKWRRDPDEWVPTVGDREVAVAIAFRDVAEGRHATPLTRPLRPFELAPYAPTDAPALVTSGSLPGPAPTAPRGWGALVALGPVVPARACRWCGGPAVVGTLNGWRCAEHPPVRGDPRGDWGWALDWTPKQAAGCLAICWCGRCPSYDPSGGIVAGARAGAAPVLPGVDAATPHPL